MSSLSLTSQSYVAAGTESYDMNTDSPHSISDETGYDFCYHLILVTNIFSFVISCFGVVTNGIIIWVLGCCATTVHPFTIYILNLAIADTGVLVSRVVCFFFLVVEEKPVPLESTSFQFFLFMCIVGQILLTAISIDRCVSVLFPIWHRYRQPAYLSIVVCVVIWILSFLVSAFHFIRFSFEGVDGTSILYPVKIASLLCLPLMTISAMILSVKVCCKTPRCQRVAVLTAITIGLLFSLLYVVPLDVICIIRLFEYLPPYALELGCLGACLNSSTNPPIYFLVGRQKVDQSENSVKATLQRLFEEQEGSVEEMELECSAQI